MSSLKIIATVIFICFLSACNLLKKEAVPEEGAVVTTYTCSMHPQIVQNKPGTCPICFMDLVMFDKTNTDASLTLSAGQQALANVTLLTIGTENMTETISLNGRLVINPEKTVFISSRVAGRVEKMFVRETGVAVKQGQPLYTIYSEQLLTMQKEFLVANAQAVAFPGEDRFKRLADAAAQKLFLFDQTLADLEQLLNTKKTNPIIVYPAPASGIVASLNITEGMYVQEGNTIITLEDYTTLWVEADVYPGDAGLFRKGQQFRVTVPALQDKDYVMRIDFVQPALLANTQLMQIRGSIANAGGSLQPGMQAIVHAVKESKPNALMLPVDAVVRDGNSNHVWVTEDKEKFFPVQVSLGMETPTTVEITEGLKQGQQVVASGAYLLYSEYILKKGRHPLD
jgi:membrane fusion protein, copper/silver efflux system